MRAQLIAEAPYRAGRFSFVHALIRETLYGELTTTRRVRLHRRVGEAIERLAQGRSDPPLADLAYHFVQAASADAADKAIDYATRAGDRAADALAHEEAARLYDMALQSLEFKEAGPGSGGAAHADLHHAARARLCRSRTVGACRSWRSSRRFIHLDPQDIERHCELVLGMASASFWLLLDIPLVHRLATEALALAEQLPDRADLAADATAWAARATLVSGDPTGAIDLDLRAIARARGRRTVAHAFAPLSFYLAGRAGEAVTLATEAADMARSSRDATFTMYALSHFGLILGNVGRYGDAAKVFDEVQQFGRRYGTLSLVARATSMTAGFHLSVFDFEGAEALQLEARDLALRVGFHPPFVSSGIDLLLTYARSHTPGRADGLLQDTAASAATNAGWHEGLWRVRLSQARAELALARGA